MLDSKDLVKINAELKKKNQTRKEVAINRIRADLTHLITLYHLFLRAKEGLIAEHDNEMTYLKTKNEIVENLQNVTNQASDILESDWTLRINDICTLARKYPDLTKSVGNTHIMGCGGCQGIISQSETLLDRMPNPPA